MFANIPISELTKWRENYTQHPALPVLTESAGISLDLLKKYISAAEKDCPGVTGLRIYFIRYELEKDLSYIKKSGDSHLSQVSITFVLVRNTDPNSFGGEDYPLPADPSKILIFPICQPTGEAWDERTGLCPPKCIW